MSTFSSFFFDISMLRYSLVDFFFFNLSQIFKYFSAEKIFTGQWSVERSANEIDVVRGSAVYLR